MSLRLVIADDEPPLRAWLRRLLADVSPEAEVVAEAADGDTALAQIERLQPDAALLDIRMPGLSGLEVAARMNGACRAVFVTAYDEFALQAFEQAAIDYMLKPVTPERLAKAMTRLSSNRPPPDRNKLIQQVIACLEQPRRAEALRWLRVGDGDTVRLIDIATVDRFEATNKYTAVYTGDRQWLIRMSLKEVETQLDPNEFWRVHRATIVRVAAIDRIYCDVMGRLWLDLVGGSAPVAVSRNHAHHFRQM
jgi:DNA-binding LytR/AlgR family response regulator